MLVNLSMWFKLIKERRTLLGLTQAELSKKSRVSVPMIQLIEANRANPSLAVFQKLNRALKIEVQTVLAPFALEALGVSLGIIRSSDTPSPTRLTRESFLQLIQQGKEELYGTKDSRLIDAYWATLLCVAEYFPSSWKKMEKQFGLTLPELTGAHIKLKRVALAEVGRVLGW